MVFRPTFFTTIMLRRPVQQRQTSLPFPGQFGVPWREPGHPAGRVVVSLLLDPRPPRGRAVPVDGPGDAAGDRDVGHELRKPLKEVRPHSPCLYVADVLVERRGDGVRVGLGADGEDVSQIIRPGDLELGRKQDGEVLVGVPRLGKDEAFTDTGPMAVSQ